MYVLNAKIEIQGDKSWQVPFVTSVEITRDTEKLTDECKVTLPKRIKWDGEVEIPVKRGDSIKVWTGYGGDQELAFAGYVRSVGIKTPIVLTCADEMFKVKQMAATKEAYTTVNLKPIL